MTASPLFDLSQPDPELFPHLSHRQVDLSQKALTQSALN